MVFNDRTDFTQLNQELETWSVEDVLRWSLVKFGDKVAHVTSFGPTGMVILDQLVRLSEGVNVITIDTDFLFPETYKLRDQVQAQYPIKLAVHQTHLAPHAQVRQHGPSLWDRNPDQCCHIRKILPLRKALQGYDAWFTGLRRDQSPTRAGIPIIEWDTKYKMIKLNPLAAWTRSDVWSYIVENNVPYNALHDRGFASIGCTHCTHRTTNLSDERSGRWRGVDKVECGIHLQLASA